MTGELTIKVVTEGGYGQLECHCYSHEVKLTDKMMMLEALMRALKFNARDRKMGIALLDSGGFAQLMQRIGAKGEMTTINLSDIHL